MKKKSSHTSTQKKTYLFKSIFWFLFGVILGLFFIISFVFIIFQKMYSRVVYPGVTIENVQFGGKSPEFVRIYFSQKNKGIQTTIFEFSDGIETATISAKKLGVGYDENLLAKQAYSIGRSQDPFTNISLILQAYTDGITLQPSYHYSESKLDDLLRPLAEKVKIPPVDALFTFENGRVSAFRLSSDGKQADTENVKQKFEDELQEIVSKHSKIVKFTIPIKTVKPEITSEKVNNLGIKEALGVGTSLFQGSIQGRIDNVILAASRSNGVLVAPNEVFSFNKTIGDVSAFTGYKQAYVIENGKTILGDGGGVCQVSTTLFRAVLNAGLPIVERHAHAYRVHYYEEDGPPGIDATVYVPTVDFKFKNDTGHYLLIQNVVDSTINRLTFYIYGTSDNREVTISQPIIKSETPAPEPVYQDDPTLPKGTVKQIDFAAAGANISFNRQVKKNGKIIISETFNSNFKPWQAIYLRGTKE